MESNFCTEPGVLNVFLIIKTFMSLLQIIVPIVLIIVCMLDVAKAVASSDDELVKVLPKMVKRIIAAVMVFLVPSILSMVLAVVDTNADYRSASCWTNANKETIETLEIAKAAQRRAEVEELSMQSYITIQQLYGPETVTIQSTVPEKMIAIALEQVGNRGTIYQQAFNARKDSAWCVYFIWWVSNEAGVFDTYMTKKAGDTGSMYRYFNSGKDANVSWHKSLSKGGVAYTPKMGDYIMFSYTPGYPTTHIGIVVKTEGDTITFVHGNTSTNPATSTVKVGTVKLNNRDISGYGSWY